MTSTTHGHVFHQGDVVARFGGSGGGDGIEIGWGSISSGASYRYAQEPGNPFNTDNADHHFGTGHEGAGTSRGAGYDFYRFFGVSG